MSQRTTIGHSTKYFLWNIECSKHIWARDGNVFFVVFNIEKNRICSGPNHASSTQYFLATSHPASHAGLNIILIRQKEKLYESDGTCYGDFLSLANHITPFPTWRFKGFMSCYAFQTFEILFIWPNHVQTCDDHWIWQFLERGGFERVTSACEKIFLRPIVSVSDSLEHLVAVNCSKALINPETALRYFWWYWRWSHRNESGTSHRNNLVFIFTNFGELWSHLVKFTLSKGLSDYKSFSQLSHRCLFSWLILTL